MGKIKLRKAVLTGVGTLTGTVAAGLLARGVVNRTHDSALKILMNDKYDENMWELVSAAMRIGVQQVVETNLRSSEGKVIGRPMGTPKRFPSMDDLMFSIAQLYIMPTPLEEKIDTRVVIGKKAKKTYGCANSNYDCTNGIRGGTKQKSQNSSGKRCSKSRYVDQYRRRPLLAGRAQSCKVFNLPV